jgi:hypothetical protein
MKNLNQPSQNNAFAAFDGLCEVHAYTGTHGSAAIKLSNVAIKKGGDVAYSFSLERATEIALKWVKKSKWRPGAFCIVCSCQTSALIRLVLGNGRILTDTTESASGTSN